MWTEAHNDQDLIVQGTKARYSSTVGDVGKLPVGRAGN